MSRHKRARSEYYAWTPEVLLRNKKDAEALLDKQFDDDYFIRNIRKIYKTIAHKGPYPDRILPFFSFVPVKLDYTVFNEINHAIKNPTHYRDCCHQNEEFSGDSMQFISKIMHPFSHLDVALIGAWGCCSQCAAIITPRIMHKCFKFAFAIDNSSFDIDMLTVICMWIANILQYDFIKQSLRMNNDLMPALMLMLLRLMQGVHFLSEQNVKLSENRQRNMYIAIWRLLQQLVVNCGYIEKYYQRKDDLNERRCQQYVLQMVRWLKHEFKIMSQQNYDVNDEHQTTVSDLSSTCLANVGVLITKISSKDILKMAGIVTNDSSGLTQFYQDSLYSIHRITHNADKIGKFFMKSVIKANKLRSKHRIKCSWRNCTKWTKAETIYRCKQCKAVTYCSKHCQKKDWKRGYHNIACKDYLAICTS